MKKIASLFLATFLIMTALMPITVFAAAPAFPEESSISVKTAGSTVLVYYPNSAVTEDGAIAPAYKVEAVAKGGNNAVVYESVFVTEETFGAEASTVIPRSFTILGQRGDFVINVYPMSSADVETAVVGTPISSDFTIYEPDLPTGAVRYEFEDYAGEEFLALAEQNMHASNGKFYTSHNGKSDWFETANYVPKEKELSITFDVELPIDSTYNIDYVVSANGNNNSVDLLELFVDGVSVGTNNDATYRDLSLDGTYPWKYIPMKQFKKTGTHFTAGTHTVTLTVNAPVSEDQPHHIFAADYVQFTPDTVMISDNAPTVLEMEHYTDKLLTDDGTGENYTAAAVSYSANASGGAALHTDSYAEGDNGYDVLINIPVSVKTPGQYNLEYVVSRAGSSTYVYVDNHNLAGYYDNTNESVAYMRSAYGKNYEALKLDEKTIFSTDKASHWSYFWRAHHAAERHDSSLYLEAGEHTITLELKTRTNMNVAICMDYIKLTPASLVATVSATDITVLEMEDYTGSITSSGEPYTDATILDNAATQQYASDGKILNMSERQKLTDATVTIPVIVEANGNYDFKWYVTNAGNGNYLSRVTLKVDGTDYLINDQSSMVEDLSYPNEAGEATYAARYYPMASYEARIPLTAGEHTITLEAAQINNVVNGGQGVKFFTDCITITPYTTKTVTVSGKTIIEAEDYVDAVYDGEAYFAGCTTPEDSRASGGKYMGTSYGYAESANVPIAIQVTKPGWYDLDAILSKKVSNYISKTEIFLNGEKVLENSATYVEEDLSENATFVNHYFPFHRYGTQVYLPEGKQTLSIYVTKTEGDSKVKFYADSITLTPSPDSVILAPKAAMITAIYEESVTGTVTFALYKENKLLKMASYDATNATKISETVPFDIAPDTIKVFAWDSFANAKPLAESKVLTDFTVKEPKLFLMGDSVCVSYGANNFWQQGWGHEIVNLFGSDVMISNNAVGGTSTKTFRTKGYWAGVEEALSIGDFVMINFGLNDFYDISETGKGTTIDQYQENLSAYCEAILAKGATPILISPMPECNTSHKALIPRANAMKEVADSFGITFLDLNNALNYQWILDEEGNYDTEKAAETFDYYFMSETAYKRLEAEYGAEIPQSQWDYIHSTNDRTHINVDGAELVAQTIADLLADSDSPLKSYLK